MTLWACNKGLLNIIYYLDIHSMFFCFVLIFVFPYLWNRAKTYRKMAGETAPWGNLQAWQPECFCFMFYRFFSIFLFKLELSFFCMYFGNLNLTPWNHTMEGENWLLWFVLWAPYPHEMYILQIVAFEKKLEEGTTQWKKRETSMTTRKLKLQ